MQRRDFCKLMAAAAAGTAVPGVGQTEDAAQSSIFHAFDTFTEDYANFCATPADRRIFYALQNGKFAKEKLDERAESGG